MLFIYSHISIARNKFVCTSLTIFSYTLVSNNIKMFCLQVLLLTQYNLFCYLLDDEKCLTSLVEHFNFVYYILFICAGSYYGRYSLFLSIENNDNKKNLDCYCKQYKRGHPVLDHRLDIQKSNGTSIHAKTSVSLNLSSREKKAIVQ